MDTLLISVTALSLLMAAAMAAVVMKMLRDERRRSDARVVALTEMAAAAETTAALAAPSRLRAEEPGAHVSRNVRVRAEEPIAAAPRTLRVQAEDRDLPLKIDSDFQRKPEATKQGERQPEATTDVRRLFDEPQRSSPWGRRLAIMAAIITFVGGGGWLLLHDTGPAPTSPAAATAAPASDSAPLELISLRHAQEADRLTITGVVQNPRSGAPRTRVVATAFAFGPDGTFVASGRAPIDFTSLGAGDESPFVVTIPLHGTVARYRVGFRAEDGTVIAHVDKRTETLAQK